MLCTTWYIATFDYYLLNGKKKDWIFWRNKTWSFCFTDIQKPRQLFKLYLGIGQTKETTSFKGTSSTTIRTKKLITATSYVMTCCKRKNIGKCGKNRRLCWDINIAISKCIPTLPICCLWLSQKIPVCSYCSPSMCKCEQRHQNSQNERCESIEKCVRYAYVTGSG